jgi:tetratricopeptide (TPR) repeat protein
MKKQPPRARTPSSLPTRHQFDHVVPTVIHNPEEKMTALGRFTHHAMQEPRRYLGWPTAIIGGLFLVVVVWKLATGGPSEVSQAWVRLDTAKTPGDRVELVKDYPNSPAKTWALLQAATEYYNQALADLPNNRDSAMPAARKALDLFEQVQRESPRDSVQARAAALGKARTLELRNDLPKAIEQYELVAQTWPGASEAEEAKGYAEALRDPQAVAFYKDLHSYSPTRVTLPPYGSETLPFPAPGGTSTTPSPAPPPGTTPSPSPGVPDIPAIEVPPLEVREAKPQPKAATPKAQEPAKAAQPPAKAESGKPAQPPAKAESGKPAGTRELIPPGLRELRIEPTTPSPKPQARPKTTDSPAKTPSEPARPDESRKDLPADPFSPR